MVKKEQCIKCGQNQYDCRNTRCTELLLASPCGICCKLVPPRCKDKDCPCHASPVEERESWEERFDKKYGVDNATEYYKGMAESIKDFIRTEIAQAQQEGEMLGKMQGIKWGEDNCRNCKEAHQSTLQECIEVVEKVEVYCECKKHWKSVKADLIINLKGDKGDTGDLTAEAQALKLLMDEDRAATASDRVATNQDALTVEAGRAQTVLKAGEAAASAGTATTQAGISVQARAGAEAARDASNLMKPTDIATFALMLAACQANQPRAFIVLDDEFQNDKDVPYTWTGRILLEYGITKCDRQPTNL